MPRRKRQNKKPSKSASEDLTRIIENVECQSDDVDGERECGRVKREGSEWETEPGTRGTPMSECERVSLVKQNGPTLKTSKQVHIVFLPDRYQTLVEVEDSEGREEEEEEEERKKEAKEKRKKEKHKKYRKNVGKALRFGWRCLVAGLQSLASGYATPLSAAATLVTDVHRTHR
ncbi:required for drug-induced death protein 1 [Oncorhynchus masou masou]|uniref:required for drug-induced death protein 1 n=1 Tax=Oncorhynchus masou masou TaxID=90313 RepID=UPI0031844D55